MENDNSLMEQFAQVKEMLEGAETDLHKFDVRGNNAAGRRARKQMMEAVKLLQDIRKGVTEKKKTNAKEALKT